MGFLPEISSSSGLSSREVQRAARSMTSAEVEVFNHRLAGWVRASKAEIDIEAAGQAATKALRVEVEFLDDGLRLAAGQPAALALVGERLAQLQRLNTNTIDQRFGGRLL